MKSICTPQKRSTTRTLTVRQIEFCHQFLVDFNARQAAIRAGYSKRSATQEAAALLKKPHIQAQLKTLAQDRAESVGLKTERALQEAMRLAFFDVRKLFDKEGAPLPISALDSDTAAAIQSVDVVTTGNAMVGIGEITKYRLADKNAALERLFKHLGLFAKDNEQSSALSPIHELLCLINGSKLPISTKKQGPA